MKNIFGDKSIVRYSPAISALLIEIGNIGQIFRMWTEKSSNDQSLIGWSLVLAALVLWYNWYRVITPDEKFAKYATGIGIGINILICCTVIWFRI